MTAFDMTIPEKFAQALQPLHPDGAQHAAAAALRLYLDLGELGVKALQARATHEDMKPAELILHLLANPSPAYIPNHTSTTSATTMTPRAAGAPKPNRRAADNHARDLQIAEEYFEGGTTYARLAAKHGLSAIRVTQIVAKARALRSAV